MSDLSAVPTWFRQRFANPKRFSRPHFTAAMSRPKGKTMPSTTRFARDLRRPSADPEHGFPPGAASGVRSCGQMGRPLGSAAPGDILMQIRNGIVEAIGNTPLIKLERASAATGCTILGKAEFMNPGGSVKDRPARQIILEAETRGDIRPGGLVVEGTAGNTGIGLALVANARGYRTTIVIPSTQSQEKKDMLRLCGADLIEVPALPYSNPNNYQHVARRLADELRKTENQGVLFADQWNNLDNRKAHYFSTGPEIWQETDGTVDGFICAIGTGGTLAGVSQFLREKRNDIVIGCADPRGAAMYELFKNGQAKATEGGSITEGIGLGRVTPIIDGLNVDYAYLIPDEEAVPVIFDLLEYEGLCLGGSSGINVAGAIRLAKELGPGKTIVTVLADSGTRYQSKLFNPEFLRSKNLPVPAWIERQPSVTIPFEKVS
jgi:cysteine synthase A